MAGGDWATPEWNVTPGSPIPISGNFGAVFLVNASPDFTPAGGDINGTADFYNTLTLSSIQLLDANGNQVNGATYLTASGASYSILGATYGPAAVPEPGFVAMLIGMGFSGAGLLFIYYLRWKTGVISLNIRQVMLTRRYRDRVVWLPRPEAGTKA